MKILILDNYDSFTYNIVHLVKQLGYSKHLDIVRNDKITLEQVAVYDKIILSPGPGVPSEANILVPLIKEYGATKSILGVCLGEQAIGECYGAQLTNLKEVYHGVATTIKLLNKEPIFDGLPDEIEVGRYHSWVVSRDNFPESELIITAEDSKGSIMALSHRRYDVKGVQFHPESILTPMGEKIIKNWLGQ